MEKSKFDFRDIARGVHFATASDRYAGWVGQIYSANQDYKTSKSNKTVKGESFAEEKLPVQSVVEYFKHYSALELDFTFYAYLLDSEGSPTRNHAPLVEYAKWLPADALVVLKVPEAICSSKLWSFQSGTRTITRNPEYLSPKKFIEQFYKPAVQILGDRIAAFNFEKGYQRKEDCIPPGENVLQLKDFFTHIPKDDRYHIEERTDRLKTESYYAFLHERGIGNVFSHWTWLPDLKTQWDQVGGFTNPTMSLTRLLTPLRVAYEESYARYHPFTELKDEFEPMYRDAAFLIKEGMAAHLPTITVVNNRAGGNAPEITRRVCDEVLKLL